MDEKTTARLGAALYRAIELLGADSNLLGIVGSLGDTMPDDWVVEELERYNVWRSGDEEPPRRDEPPGPRGSDA
jgi:hypothetical protein